MEKIKVIYILGSGRSGSTILGIVLGNIKNHFFGGELHLWNKDKGMPAEDFEFWDKVNEGVPHREEFFKCNFDKKLEFHTAILSIFKSQKREIVKSFNEQSVELFTSMQNVAQASTIIDSSHYAPRAYWLNQNPAMDVHYIYLYRNPVDVMMGSFKRKDIEQPSKNFFSGNYFLFAVSCLSNLVYVLLPRKKRMKLRYEDFITHPVEELNRIQKKFNIEIENLDLQNLKPGHIFRANRIRLYDKISLETKLKKTPINPFLKAVIYIIHFPFLLTHRRRY